MQQPNFKFSSTKKLSNLELPYERDEKIFDPRPSKCEPSNLCPLSPNSQRMMQAHRKLTSNFRHHDNYSITRYCGSVSKSKTVTSRKAKRTQSNLETKSSGKSNSNIWRCTIDSPIDSRKSGL